MRTPRIDRFTLFLAALGLLGAALILLRIANNGVEIEGDALLYVSTAQGLLAGNGFASNWGHLYENAAPLFPLALASAGLLGLNVINAAGYINAAAFGLTAFATAIWLRRRVRSRWLVVWAGGTCILSLSLVYVSTRAWTEPLFILFLVLALFALDRFLDTRQRSFLLLAAGYAALVCLTRYIGLTLVLSALLLLLLQRGATFPARIGNAAVFSVLALTPIGLWMLRNLLNSGTLTGAVYPTNFWLLSSLHRASSELVKWILGTGVFYVLDRWIARISGISISGEPTIEGVAVKLALLLVWAAAVGYLLFRLHRGGYRQNWGIWAIPSVFIGVYGLALVVSLPLTDVDLPSRYLAPLYPPTLVMAVLALNEFLRWGEGQKPLAELRFLQKWNLNGVKRLTPSLPVAILAIGLSLWLAQQVYINYRKVDWWMNTRTGYRTNYGSREWENSETIHYLRSHPPNAHIWTNLRVALRLLTDIQDRIHPLEFPLSKGPKPWFMAGEDTYFVLFHSGFSGDSEYEHAFRQVAALPAIETVAELEDGVILKAVKDTSGYAGTLDEGALLRAGLPKEAQPVIRSVFNVYREEGENRLIYARDDCSEADIAPPFFLHIGPVNQADLPGQRRQYGYDNLDFPFDGYGFRSDGLCVAKVDLPDYDIAEIRTGQFVSDQGQLWRGEFNFADE